MLTLALGIGATTAIFSLIHSVMLKSLPVVDPSMLVRVGEGNDCCVEGGMQDNWGMYSYQLYKRFADAAPEFEQLAAFQAGGSQFSVRRSETALRVGVTTGRESDGCPSFAERTWAEKDGLRVKSKGAPGLAFETWDPATDADWRPGSTLCRPHPYFLPRGAGHSAEA
jgi:galactose mutarotase-like enzyme